MRTQETLEKYRKHMDSDCIDPCPACGGQWTGTPYSSSLDLQHSQDCDLWAWLEEESREPRTVDCEICNREYGMDTSYQVGDFVLCESCWDVLQIPLRDEWKCERPSAPAIVLQGSTTTLTFGAIRVIRSAIIEQRVDGLADALEVLRGIGGTVYAEAGDRSLICVGGAFTVGVVWRETSRQWTTHS